MCKLDEASYNMMMIDPEEDIACKRTEKLAKQHKHATVDMQLIVSGLTPSQRSHFNARSMLKLYRKEADRARTLEHKHARRQKYGAHTSPHKRL